jgi:hypothetical protein
MFGGHGANHQDLESFLGKKMAEFLPEVDGAFYCKDDLIGRWIGDEWTQFSPQFGVESVVGVFKAKGISYRNSFRIDDHNLVFFLGRIDSNDYLTVNKVPFRLQRLQFHSELLSLNWGIGGDQ